MCSVLVTSDSIEAVSEASRESSEFERITDSELGEVYVSLGRVDGFAQLLRISFTGTPAPC